MTYTSLICFKSGTFVFFPSCRRQNARCTNAGSLPTVWWLTKLCIEWIEQCVYPANPLRVHLHAPFRVGILTRDVEMFNESMCAVRSSVEWLFGDIVNYFKFLDFKKNLKIGLSQVGKMYIVCSILRNALTCLYSNTTADFFGLDPPALNDYFN